MSRLSKFPPFYSAPLRIREVNCDVFTYCLLLRPGDFVVDLPGNVELVGLEKLLLVLVALANALTPFGC